MALAAILSSMKTALTSVSGVATVRDTVPEAPTTLTFPAIVLEVQPFTVQPSTLTYWTYPIDIYYLHAERAATSTTDLSAELAAIYPIPKAIFDALIPAATLGGKVYGINWGAPSGEIGVTGWRDKSYIGCVMHAIVKEKYATAFSG